MLQISGEGQGCKKGVDRTVIFKGWIVSCDHYRIWWNTGFDGLPLTLGSKDIDFSTILPDF